MCRHCKGGKGGYGYVKSLSMNKDVQVVVVTPEKKGNYPVIYLLHGYGGNAKSWIELKPELPG